VPRRVSKQILNIAADGTVSRTRELILERAGFAVVSVASTRDAEHVLRRGIFDLAVLGHEYTGEQKTRLAAVVRSLAPKTPILEICRISPEIKAEYMLIAPGPEDLIREVKRSLSGNQQTASSS
jgi:DNA-binding NtrC family response regulator